MQPTFLHSARGACMPPAREGRSGKTGPGFRIVDAEPGSGCE
ncbi:MAG: hypothetical protein ABW321_33680 [Polyangiales bacterium]